MKIIVEGISGFLFLLGLAFCFGAGIAAFAAPTIIVWRWLST